MAIRKKRPTPRKKKKATPAIKQAAPGEQQYIGEGTDNSMAPEIHPELERIGQTVVKVRENITKLRKQLEEETHAGKMYMIENEMENSYVFTLKTQTYVIKNEHKDSLSVKKMPASAMKQVDK